MTNRKSQNSILFLTTLGVYLGLVLVGATPQVLAQAATTRNFDISEEVGQIENLDTDPGNNRRNEHSVATKIRRSVSVFLSELSPVAVCDTSPTTPESLTPVAASNTAIVIVQAPAIRSLTTLLSPRHLARASI